MCLGTARRPQVLHALILPAVGVVVLRSEVLLDRFLREEKEPDFLVALDAILGPRDVKRLFLFVRQPNHIFFLLD